MSRRHPAILRRAIVAAIAATAALTVGSAKAQQPTAGVDVVDPDRLVSELIATLARRASDPTSDQDARDVAMRRLLEIDREPARAAVAAALTDPANAGARLAAARAVAADPTPDTRFINPLFVLLDATQPKATLDAAATALGNYKALPDVTTRLLPLTEAKRPEVVRLAAIAALSAQIEKAAAGKLVELAADPQPKVAAAASEALGSFAARPAASAAEWADWWASQADRPDDRFRLDVLTARASRLEVSQRRGDETFGELRRGTMAALTATPRDAQGDALMKLLRSPVDAVRLIGARQASSLARTGDLPAAARPAVRQLLGDPSADVRIEAVRAVQGLSDADAFAGLAAQAFVEPDPRVRAEMPAALGAIGSVAAVPVLQRLLLDDPSPAVMQASAAALGAVGESLATTSPAQAQQLARQLRGLLATRAGRNNPRIREAVVRALVPLRQPDMLDTFAHMLTDTTPRESVGVREAAARGLGTIGDPRVTDLLAETLNDDAAEVRLAAVGALGSIGRQGRDFISGESLLRRMDAKNEADPRVRDAAWVTLKSLLEFAPSETLAAWLERPAFKNDPAKRIDLLTSVAHKAESDPDAKAAAIQQIGDAQMQLNPPQYAEAAASYEQSLALIRGQGRGKGMVVEGLVNAAMGARLRGRDFAGAAKFASDQLKGPDGAEYMSNVGYAFNAEANRLVGDNKRDDALRLIQTALEMDPPLGIQYREQLADIRRTVETGNRQRNELDAPAAWLHALADAR